jgi:hypothetical protein
MKREAPAEPACKITMQYRAGNGFMYELESSGVIFGVHVSRAEASGQTDSFSVTAHHGRNTPAVVSESGPTGDEALRNVARTWTAKCSELGLPTLDWNKIAAVLVAVRAI